MKFKFAVSSLVFAAAVMPSWSDQTKESQMLTYSRAKGLFVGIDLGGSLVERDKDSTVALYGKDLTTRAVLDGEVRAPAAAREFLPEVRRPKAVAASK